MLRALCVSAARDISCDLPRVQQFVCIAEHHHKTFCDHGWRVEATVAERQMDKSVMDMPGMVPELAPTVVHTPSGLRGGGLITGTEQNNRSMRCSQNTIGGAIA